MISAGYIATDFGTKVDCGDTSLSVTGKTLPIGVPVRLFTSRSIWRWSSDFLAFRKRMGCCRYAPRALNDRPLQASKALR